jgi:prepilin-type N-terminal cleavage/methylation domain-containing protein/prepilin-type processing-associated H-X9-DG protein
MNRRNAFTLLELLVVIVIIAILATVIAANFTQIRENGWSTHCKANLKNLYQATLNYMADKGQYFPLAHPYEEMDLQTGKWVNYEAWVTWVMGNANATPRSTLWADGASHAPAAGGVGWPTWYGADGQISMRNGTLWDYVNRSAKNYLCPKFGRSSVCGRTDAVRSYAMNAQVSWAQPLNMSLESSRTILFAEMQPQVSPWRNRYPGRGGPVVCTTWAGNDQDGNDGRLESTVVSATQSKETVGYLHRMAGEFRGHAVFCDGHVEAIALVNLGGGSWSNRIYDACHGQF